ncbi:MAG: HpcH/HpaI aldolase family protein [Opitutaceae bacterium]
MNTRSCRILKLLRRGDIPKLLKINLSEPRVVEIAGLCGADGVWLCTEHVPNDWIGIENQIRAGRVHDIDVLVRVARGSYSDYIRPLEAGATGIIVPHVNSADEARQIVDWVRFHPIGRRAIDGGNVDGNFCQLPLEDYILHSNSERIIILQIESPEALEQVEEIAAVPGFEGLLFGPGDFSHRIGKVGRLDLPEIASARKRIAAAATQHGKFAMTSGLIAPVEQLLAEGYRVFNLGADVALLGDGFKERLSAQIGNPSGLPTLVKIGNQSLYG